MNEFCGTGSICIFGGTFDPVHLGHLVVAERALEFCGAEKAVFLPSCAPPHKSAAARAPAASFAHRVRMAAIAVEGNHSFAVSDREGRRTGPSYTVDLLREIRAESPGLDVCFLVGADWVSGLSSWKDIGEIFGLCRFIVAPRPGYTKGDVRIAARDLGGARSRELERNWIPAPEIGISSTEIRERIASGLPVRYLLPPGVREYIERHGLYRGPRLEQ